mmetsp:Transcript_232/g.369  ORF Transcript_232/g.369 Transcript_232/m.369 type:complete len:242 (+) Transcript_232:200-925(+)
MIAPDAAPIKDSRSCATKRHRAHRSCFFFIIIIAIIVDVQLQFITIRAFQLQRIPRLILICGVHTRVRHFNSTEISVPFHCVILPFNPQHKLFTIRHIDIQKQFRFHLEIVLTKRAPHRISKINKLKQWLFVLHQPNTTQTFIINFPVCEINLIRSKLVHICGMQRNAYSINMTFSRCLIALRKNKHFIHIQMCSKYALASWQFASQHRLISVETQRITQKWFTVQIKTIGIETFENEFRD